METNVSVDRQVSAQCTKVTMYSKVVILMVVAGAVIAEHAHSSQHIHKHDGHHELVTHGHKHEHHDYYTVPKYEFEYKIKDPHTHDYKSQHEHREHDSVKGYYELHDPDGTLRHVPYHADKHSGFHAPVKHSTHHIVPKHHHH